MRIADILRSKGPAVATVTATTTVTELLAELAVLNIGSLVVVGADGVVGHRVRARRAAQTARVRTGPDAPAGRLTS